MCVELMWHPDQRARLAADPAILGTTGVEEFIRWVTPILNMRRTATEDHDLHGETIHAGDEVLLMYSSANRDERVFTDPETLDVTRDHNHHVAFGFGSHFCLGASLARLEIRVMFEELLRRIPEMRLLAGAERAGSRRRSRWATKRSRSSSRPSEVDPTPRSARSTPPAPLLVRAMEPPTRLR